MKKLILGLISLIIITSVYSSNEQGIYESEEIRNAYDKGTRSHNGIPGKNYWQNTSHYNLKAELDPESKILNGTGTIKYYNNSPDTLRYLIVKLLPNISKRGSARDYAMDGEQLNEGMVIDSIAVNGNGGDLSNRRAFFEYGTNLYIIFDRARRVLPNSETEIYIQWNYELVNGGLRNGAYNDSSFFIGYWYPQMAVYDDVYGWDREDYTGKQETYNDLGTYEVEISVPEDYVVWATGDQLNEKDIFSEHTLDLIKKSRNSTESIHILTSESYTNNVVFKKDRSTKWKFIAQDVPDFAWACSNYYLWDANTLVLENEKDQDVWISAVYPQGTQSFDKVADVAHQGIDYLSNIFPGVPYPFNKHITFNGIHYIGVEYPMIANNGDHAGKEMYTELTIHEIAHNYIPFYMLSNERKHAWIDEGWVKLMGELHGESLGIKREEKEALNTVQRYERTAGCSNDLPLIVPSSFMTTTYNFYHSYAKAANANMYLLELMKEVGIDNPLKEFLTAWKGKHPTPYDFFNFMNDLCEEDLAWYWNPWYFEFSAPDQGIKTGKEKGQVVIINSGGIPLPVRLTLTYNDGHEEAIEESIWNWADNKQELTIELDDFENIEMITLGSPGIPDMDRSNNTMKL